MVDYFVDVFKRYPAQAFGISFLLILIDEQTSGYIVPKQDEYGGNSPNQHVVDAQFTVEAPQQEFLG